MIVEYHTHTSLCKHGEGEIEDYIERAIELGFNEVGCSEHSPMPNGFDVRHRMSIEQYQTTYAPAVTAAREKYKDRIAVRRGLEADFFPGTTEWVKKFIEENDFDYVIGSVHILGKPGSEQPLFHTQDNGRELEALYVDYFEAIRASAECGLFDIIAHCDLVKKHGACSSNQIDEVIREALRAIKRNDLCVEINTSGLRKAEAEVYPAERILLMIKEFSIPLTLGSDAHKPSDVGRDFDKAVELIEYYGDGKLSVFDRRQRSEVPVSKFQAV